VRLLVIDEWTAAPRRRSLSPCPRTGTRTWTSAFSSGAVRSTHITRFTPFVEFEEAGRKLVAHPIRIIQTDRPNPPLAESPVEWKPFQVSANGSLALWRLPIHREHVRVEQIAGPGTQAGSIYETRPTVDFRARQVDARNLEAINLALGPRPPSLRERVSWAATEFPLQLPATGSIRLTVSAAASGPAVGDTGRIRLMPIEDAPSPEQSSEVVFETKVSPDSSTEETVDLSRFAGKAVRLQFEAATGAPYQPGGVNWIEPVLLTGQVPLAAPFPPPPAQRLKL